MVKIELTRLTKLFKSLSGVEQLTEVNRMKAMLTDVPLEQIQ
jgi:hypothetical protein